MHARFRHVPDVRDLLSALYRNDLWRHCNEQPRTHREKKKKKKKKKTRKGPSTPEGGADNGELFVHSGVCAAAEIGQLDFTLLS
jgi:hypothetical protein